MVYPELDMAHGSPQSLGIARVARHPALRLGFVSACACMGAFFVFADRLVLLALGAEQQEIQLLSLGRTKVFPACGCCAGGPAQHSPRALGKRQLGLTVFCVTPRGSGAIEITRSAEKQEAAYFVSKSDSLCVLPSVPTAPFLK